MTISIGWYFVLPVLALAWLAQKYPRHRRLFVGYAGRFFRSGQPGPARQGNILTRNWLAGVLILGALVIAVGFSLISPHVWDWAPFWKTPRLADVGPWIWHNWLPVLLIWGAVAALIEKMGGDYSKKLHLLATLVILALFFAIPGGIWGAEEAGVTLFPRAHCGFSSTSVHTCALTEDWSFPTTADIWTEENEYQFCVVTPDGVKVESKKVGLNSWELRSTFGSATIQVEMLKTATLPNGKCPNTF